MVELVLYFTENFKDNLIVNIPSGFGKSLMIIALGNMLAELNKDKVILILSNDRMTHLQLFKKFQCNEDATQWTGGAMVKGRIYHATVDFFVT